MADDATLAPEGARPPLLMVRLSIMMLLQWAMFGLWVPVAGRFLRAAVAEGGLGFSNTQLGWVIGISGTIGAVLAPFVGGQIADRYVSTERLMAVLLLVGGVLKFLTAYQTTYAAWLGLSIGAAIALSPTIALSNSLAFAHMSDPSSQFPRVRLWGTIGWIIPAWVFPMVWLQTGLGLRWTPPFLAGQEVAEVTHRLVDAFKVSGALAILYALYCLTLPHTPPKRDAAERLAVRKAFRLLRWRSFAVLVAVSLLVAGIHQVYFIQTSQFLKHIGLRDADIMPAMSVAQIAEIFMMAALGLMLKRLGFRRVLAIGASAYVLRYAIFGTTSLSLGLIVASQALHGVCFACFIATAFIYVNQLADDDVRHSAQTLYAVLLGAGPVIGGWLNGTFALASTRLDYSLDYSAFWLRLAVIGVAATLLIAVLFRDETRDRGEGQATS